MPPLRLTVPEGDALLVLDTLLGLATSEPPRAVSEWPAVRPALAAVALRRIAVASVRYLVRSGGARERALLRDGRRASGRLWSPEVSLGWTPHYTRATYDFWVSAARQLPGLGAAARAQGSAGAAGAGVETEGKRKHRRAVRDLVSIDGTRSGDWLFFALVRQNLGRFSLDPEDRLTLEKRLRRASPLVMAFDLEGVDESDAELAARYALLFAPPDVRLVECLDAPLERAWLARADELWAARLPADALALRFRTHARALRAYVAAADAAGRSDLLVPVLRFLVGLATRTLREGGAAVRAKAAALPGVRSLAARDELLSAMAELVGVALQVQRLRDALAMERYGDDRYEEAQVFLRMYAEHYAPQRAAVEALLRGLTGAVG